MNFVLGRIVTERKVIEGNYLNDKNIKLVKLSDEYIEDTKTPTLLVGWELVSSIFGENVSILNKKIRKNLFWTFSPQEKMQQFNEDVEKFIYELYHDLIEGHEYYFIDPIIDSISKIDHLFRFIDDENYDSIYITDDFIYMYTKSEKLILGIDIKYYRRLQFNIEKIIEALSKRSHVVLTEDYTDQGVYQNYKKYLNIEFDKKYIPLLETLKG